MFLVCFVVQSLSDVLVVVAPPCLVYLWLMASWKCKYAEQAASIINLLDPAAVNLAGTNDEERSALKLASSA